jgi:hypothetical protein
MPAILRIHPYVIDDVFPNLTYIFGCTFDLVWSVITSAQFSETERNCYTPLSNAADVLARKISVQKPAE